MSVIRQGPGDIVFIDRPNPELEAQLDARFQRLPGLLQWKVPNRGAVSLAFEFVKTVTSGIVDDETLERRKQSCLACPAMAKDTQGNLFCAACSCGRWQLARLDGTFLPKLGWKGTKCPLGRF